MLGSRSCVQTLCQPPRAHTAAASPLVLPVPQACRCSPAGSVGHTPICLRGPRGLRAVGSSPGLSVLLKPPLAPLPTGRAERVPGRGRTTCGLVCLVRHQGHSGSRGELRRPPLLPQPPTLPFRENSLGALCTAAPRDRSASPSPQVEPTAREAFPPNRSSLCYRR